MSKNLVFVLVAVLFTSLSAPVYAQEPQVHLGIIALESDKSFFNITLAPGEMKELAVRFSNKGDEGIAVSVYASDVYSIYGGGLGMSLINEPKTGPTEWLDFPSETTDLVPGEGFERSFMVTVPEDTEPGDYITSIVIQNADPVEISSSIHSTQLTQTVRHGVAVAIDVPGPRTPDLEISSVDHKFLSQRSMVDFDISNPGNQHLKPSGELVLASASGEVLDERAVNMDSVYAWRETKLEVVLAEKLEPGDYFATLTLTDEETGTTARAERLPFTVEQPPEPDPLQEADENPVTAIINDPHLPGGGGTGSLIWLIGMIAATAGLAALVGVAMGRRRSGPTASASVVVTEAQGHARPRAEAPTALRKAHTSPQIRPLLPPKSAR